MIYVCVGGKLVLWVRALLLVHVKQAPKHQLLHRYGVSSMKKLHDVRVDWDELNTISVKIEKPFNVTAGHHIL